MSSQSVFAFDKSPSPDYKSKISKLRKHSVFTADSSIEVYEYQGFWVVGNRLEGLMCAQDHFKADPTDILVASSPKTGTTWLTSLTFAISTRNQYAIPDSPLQTTLSHLLVPPMESAIAQNQPHQFFRQISPLFSTHTPYGSLPTSIITSQCKIIYIWRDPTDTFVSFWHFIRSAPIFKDTKFLSIEDAFQQFCDGYSPYGPYLEHIMGYWKASLERPDKILFLKYEDLKTNTLTYVKKLADFMGFPFSAEEEKEGIIDKIIDLCSFKYLSNLEVNKTGRHQHFRNASDLKNASFFRKAEVGDWKNHLPADMKQQMDKIMELKLRGCGLTLKNPSSDTDSVSDP